MKCFILRWNPERNTFTQKHFKELQADFAKEEDVSLRWEVEQWEEAEKGNLFILVQYNSENEGIAMIGKFASDPYERINGELIDNFVADKLTLRINDELQARDIWDKWTFGEFMGMKMYYRP